MKGKVLLLKKALIVKGKVLLLKNALIVKGKGLLLKNALIVKGKVGTPHREPFGEVEALLRLGGGGASAGDGAGVGGAKEAGLVQAELLQLLGVHGERGGEQQLLQRHLGRGQAAGRRQTVRHAHRRQEGKNHSSDLVSGYVPCFVIDIRCFLLYRCWRSHSTESL